MIGSSFRTGETGPNHSSNCSSVCESNHSFDPKAGIADSTSSSTMSQSPVLSGDGGAFVGSGLKNRSHYNFLAYRHVQLTFSASEGLFFPLNSHGYVLYCQIDCPNQLT